MPAAPPAICEATDSRERRPITGAPARAEKSRSGRRQRIADLITRVLWTSYRDPRFERPDVVEDDYFRFINQPRGW